MHGLNGTSVVITGAVSKTRHWAGFTRSLLGPRATRQALRATALLVPIWFQSCAYQDSTRPPEVTSGVTTTVPVTTGPGSDLEPNAALDRLGIPKLDSAEWTAVFRTGFEAVEDFGAAYSTPQSETTRHELSTEQVHSGSLAHKGWLTGIVPAVPEVDGPNHRGYPTVQLDELDGGCPGACLVEFWVWLDVSLGPGQWFSLATLSSDSSDRWLPVVTVNVGAEGTLHTFHVPRHGLAEREFQATQLFPMKRWVRVTTYIDFRADGAIATWQDGTLTSAARIERGAGVLEQAHFGLYAPPDLLEGTVFNDDLTIWHLNP